MAQYACFKVGADMTLSSLAASMLLLWYIVKEMNTYSYVYTCSYSFVWLIHNNCYLMRY